jgi:hypothetical protein
MKQLRLIKGNDEQPLNCNGQDLHFMLFSKVMVNKKQSFIQLLFYFDQQQQFHIV